MGRINRRVNKLQSIVNLEIAYFVEDYPKICGNRFDLYNDIHYPIFM